MSTPLVTGTTSQFPAKIDKIPIITPFTAATPGSWGDYVTPFYVNHIADGVYKLYNKVHGAAPITIEHPILWNSPGTTNVFSSGEVVYITRWCVPVTNLYVRSIVYDLSGVTFLAEQPTLFDIPINAKTQLNLTSTTLPVSSTVVSVTVDARPIGSTVNTYWDSPWFEIYPYASINGTNLCVSFRTPTPGIHALLGAAYLSFELVVCKL